MNNASRFSPLLPKWSHLLVLSLLLSATSAPSEPSNTHSRAWLPLTEVLAKWNSVPLETVEQEAQSGDLTAQHYLGYCNAEGLRGLHDSAQAVRWYQHAGESGYLPSWSNLGFLYQRGKGVPQDYSKTVYYYRLAADAGFPGAQANLAFLYRDGLGVHRDFVTAMKWLQMAAAHDEPKALVEIGRFYRFGWGVPKDLDVAETWFLKAVRPDHPEAEFNLAMLYEERGDTDKASSFYLKAAQHGDADAMAFTYLAYWNGNGLPQNRSEAMNWLRRGAEAGSAYAQCLLGYRYGDAHWDNEAHPTRLIPANMPEAIKWYRRSAEQNWSGGLYFLGLCYLKGEGTDPDEDRGLELIRRAADQEHTKALVELSKLYAQGIGEPRNDDDQPLPLLMRAIRAQSEDSYYDISWAYDNIVLRYQYGLGTERDLVAAVEWYCRAALANVYGYTLKYAATKDKALQQAKYNWSGGFKALEEVPGVEVYCPPVGPVNAQFMELLLLYVSAARGDSKAALRLGEVCAAGRDMPVSRIQAWTWFTLAARSAEPGTAARISQMESLMQPAELKQAQQSLERLQRDLSAVAAGVRALSQ